MDIKFDYPHTFFLSIGIILLILGIYPFYFNNFNFSLMNLTQIIIHFVALIISIICLINGFRLWEESETDKKEMAEASRKRINQIIKINEFEIEEMENKKELSKLKEEIELIDKSKNLKNIEKLKYDQQIKIKKDEINRLSNEIQKKREERNKDIKTFYTLQKDEISKLPDSFFAKINSSTTGSVVPISLSGSSFFPASGAIMNPFDLNNSAGFRLITPEKNVGKKCSRCNKIFFPIFNEELCPECNSRGRVLKL